MAVAVIFAIMVASIPAAMGIPFGPFLGWDFCNLDAFHDCVSRNNPYLSTGAACGVVGSGDMGYPPLLYWSFVWTRLLPLPVGAILWAVVVLAGVVIATLAWVPQGQRSLTVVAFVGLLALQYPTLFAMERGNNDVLVLVIWTASMRLFVSGRGGLSGAVAGTAAALKIYPAFAAVVVGCGLLWWAWCDRSARHRAGVFAAGGVGAVALAVFVFWDQTGLYLSDEFIRIATWSPLLSTYTHALDNIAPFGVGWLLSLLLLVAWIGAAAKRLPSDPVIVFAGGLAISTYFASVSFDYNLLTTYPLLILLFVRSLSVVLKPLVYVLLLLGVAGIVGNRELFDGSDLMMQVHIALQWLWLLSVGAAVAGGWLRESQAMDAAPRTMRSHFNAKPANRGTA